jgi:thioredoxin 1
LTIKRKEKREIMNRMITKADMRKEVMGNTALSLVKFKTDWSGTCQIIEPVYKDLANSYKGVVNFYTIDVEAEKGIESEYGIMELPTILFFKGGKIVDHAVGLTSRNILITKIENAIAAANN